MRPFLLVLLLLLSFNLFAQKQDVEFKVRNAGWLPRKVTLIAYWPGTEGNETVSFFLLPGFYKRVVHPAGTRLYVASDRQVNTVMSGSSISKDPPFLVVRLQDRNKTFRLP